MDPAKRRESASSENETNSPAHATIREDHEHAILNQFGVSPDKRDLMTMNAVRSSDGDRNAAKKDNEKRRLSRGGSTDVQNTRSVSLSSGDLSAPAVSPMTGKPASAVRIKKSRKSDERPAEPGLDTALELLTNSSVLVSPNRSAAVTPFSPSASILATTAKSPISTADASPVEATLTTFKKQLSFEPEREAELAEQVFSEVQSRLMEASEAVFLPVEEEKCPDNFLLEPATTQGASDFEPLPVLHGPPETSTKGERPLDSGPLLTVSAPVEVAATPQRLAEGSEVFTPQKSPGDEQHVPVDAVSKPQTDGKKSRKKSSNMVATKSKSIQNLAKKTEESVAAVVKEPEDIDQAPEPLADTELKSSKAMATAKTDLGKLGKKGLSGIAAQRSVDVTDYLKDREERRKQLTQAPVSSSNVAKASEKAVKSQQDAAVVETPQRKVEAPSEVSVDEPTPLQKPVARPRTEEEKKAKLAKEWEFKHQLPRDLSRLVLTVGEPKIFGGSTSSIVQTVVTNSISDGHIRFKISRALPDDLDLSAQFVHRRYRDFQALCLRLANVFPHLVLPGLPSGWATIMKTEEFLQTRSRRLEGYLIALLRNRPQVWQSEDLAAFLLTDSEAFDEMATRYLSNSGQDLAVPPPTVSSKFGESLSFWMKTAQATLGTTTKSESSMSDHQIQLSSSYEALNAWVDGQGTVQDRSATVEELTAAFESFLSLSVSKGQVLSSLKSSLADFVGNDSGVQSGGDESTELFLDVFDPCREMQFAKDIIGEAKPLEDESNEGPLRSLHQCAALLSGAKDLYSRISSEQVQTTPKEAGAVIKQFSALRKTTSRTGLRVAQTFAYISAERALAEVRSLEELKRMIEQNM